MKKPVLFSILFLLFSCSNVGRLGTASSNPTGTKELDLSYSGLTKVPPEIGTMVNLEKLVLFKNKIDSLPSFIGNLLKLQELSMQSNRLIYVAPEIGELQN